MGGAFGRAVSWPPTEGADVPSDVVTLVRRARAGDVDAFASLVISHDRDIRAVAARLIRDPHDAEDIRQEVWLRVAERIGTLKDAASFGAWVRTIARNISLNFLREHSWRLHVTDTREREADQVALLLDEDNVGPDHHVLAQDDQCEIWEALGALSEQDRLVLRLREIEELSYAEIAKALHTSAHAAEMRSSRARERLRYEIVRITRTSSTPHVSRFDLTRLMDDAPTTVIGFSVRDHVTECGRCTQQLATMRVGRDVFTGFAGVMLVPRALTDLASRLRGLLRGDVVSAVRMPAPELVHETVGGPVSALMSAGGAAAAATVLAVTAAFAGVLTDAHELPDVVAENAMSENAATDRAATDLFVQPVREDPLLVDDEVDDAGDATDVAPAADSPDAEPAQTPPAVAPQTLTPPAGSPSTTAPTVAAPAPAPAAKGQARGQDNAAAAQSAKLVRAGCGGGSHSGGCDVGSHSGCGSSHSGCASGRDECHGERGGCGRRCAGRSDAARAHIFERPGLFERPGPAPRAAARARRAASDRAQLAGAADSCGSVAPTAAAAATS